MFVKFACGCIGLRPTVEPEGRLWLQALVFQECDGCEPKPEYSFYFRKVRYDQPPTPLNEAQTALFAERFGRHLGRGHAALDALQNLSATLAFLARTNCGLSTYQDDDRLND